MHGRRVRPAERSATTSRSADGGEPLAPSSRAPRTRSPNVSATSSVAEARRLHLATPTTGAGTKRIDASVRARVEEATGSDLGGARLHTGADATAIAHDAQARAVTIGSDIYFAPNAYAPGTPDGDRRLAHELAHVVQSGGRSGSAVLPVSSPADRAEQDAGRFADALVRGDGIAAQDVSLAGAAPMAFRDPAPSSEQVDERAVLRELFGSDALAALDKEIAANADAAKLLKERGSAAYLALESTRQGGKLSLPNARKALDDDAKRKPGDREFTLTAMKARPEPAKRYWFQTKAPGKGDGEYVTAAREEEEVFVEEAGVNIGQLAVVSAGKLGPVVVRFAYQKREMRGDRLSADAKQGRKLVLDAIAGVMTDLASLPPAPDKKTRAEDERTRARLKAVVSGFTEKRPLNVYLAETTTAEMLSGGRVIETARIFVSPNDIGNRTKLETAIRMPFTALLGGDVGARTLPALSAAEMKEAVLHEGLHALLLAKGAAMDTVWERLAPQIKLEGTATMRDRATQLIKLFLLAQEESFVYEQTAKLGGEYQSRVKNKAVYDAFVDAAKALLIARAGGLEKLSVPLLLKGKGKKAAVDWAMTFSYPKSILFDVADLTMVNALIRAYPGG